MLCSSSGKIIRFPESDCRPQGRVSQGVKGIAINEDEKIIGMELIDDNVEILSVTENGYGKEQFLHSIESNQEVVREFRHEIDRKW